MYIKKQRTFFFKYIVYRVRISNIDFKKNQMTQFGI